MFLSFRCRLFYTILTYNTKKSCKIASPSIAITAGAATIVDNKLIIPAPAPMVIVIKIVSTLSTILATLKYFLLKASLVATSFSRNV